MPVSAARRKNVWAINHLLKDQGNRWDEHLTWKIKKIGKYIPSFTLD